MTKYLLDTNVVLRFCNPSDVQHNLATDSSVPSPYKIKYDRAIAKQQTRLSEIL
ncbi:MAG TPA: hypothetical protein V6C85_28880 [Allocoleopsis sp.]